MSSTAQVTAIQLDIISNNPSSESNAQIQIDSDIDLVWSIAGGNSIASGLQLAINSGTSFPFNQFTLNSKILEFHSSSSSPTNFSLTLHVEGKADYFEGCAILGYGWTMNAIINGATTIWNSGNIKVPLD